MKHTPHTAALAVRALLGDTIARTWPDYFDGQHKANAYTASLLVMEQVNGPGKRTPCSFRRAARAVARVIPELFADYWDALEHTQPISENSAPSVANP